MAFNADNDIIYVWFLEVAKIEFLYVRCEELESKFNEKIIPFDNK